MFEEALAGAFGLARFGPQVFEAIADGTEGGGQKVHGREHRRQIFFAVAEIMFKMIAVVLQDVESLILDFPPRSGASSDLGDGCAGNVE
jgi:hypothetical protein